jgi:hypothetical protein
MEGPGVVVDDNWMTSFGKNEVYKCRSGHLVETRVR